jgi:hypothetical protein
VSQTLSHTAYYTEYHPSKRSIWFVDSSLANRHAIRMCVYEATGHMLRVVTPETLQSTGRGISVKFTDGQELQIAIRSLKNLIYCCSTLSEEEALNRVYFKDFELFVLNLRSSGILRFYYVLSVKLHTSASYCIYINHCYVS